MDLNTFPKTRDQYSIYIGPLSPKDYEAVKEYMSSLGIGYSATYSDKKMITIVTDQRQLTRGGIVLEFEDVQQ